MSLYSCMVWIIHIITCVHVSSNRYYTSNSYDYILHGISGKGASANEFLVYFDTLTK